MTINLLSVPEAARMFCILTVLTVFFLTAANGTIGHCSIEAAPYNTAVELYGTLAEGNPESQGKWEEKIRSLPYTSLVVFRAFCNLPDITMSEAQSVLLRLQKAEIRYETTTILEYFCAQPGADILLAWQFLEKLKSTNFVTNSVLASLKRVSVPSAPLLFPIIDQVERLEEAGKWAAKALFEVDKISYTGLSEGLNALSTLTESQSWAAERFCQLTGIDEQTTLKGIREIQKLSFANSWNSRSIFLATGTSPDSALSWLSGFFVLPQKDQDHTFIQLPIHKKAELLAAFVDASEKLIWQINNLHDVTDDSGWEIGDYGLKKSSFAQLLRLFALLDKDVQNLYRLRMNRAVAAENKNETIMILHLATERARKEAALKLTSSNIYILLAQGNDLYDSSFRDILVPVLQQRMKASFQDDLLEFMLTIDPGNSSSSNFITNLAQKGKLIHFLPKELNRQKEIIDLVTRSAFQDQNSLILFSATFIKLLQIIDPKIRSHLINIMLNTIKTDDSTLSSQLQVILQHYIKLHMDLLPPEDKIKLFAMIQERGEISTAAFERTPFAEWLSDNALQSLSVFQPDDDGINSFFSYCRALIRKGYRPSLSEDYRLTNSDTEQDEELTALLKALQHQPENNLSLLFRISAKKPIVIDWKKKLHGTDINHSIFIYQDKRLQQELIARFLASGHEMFAQRGHSYWRHEQLIEPFEALSKTDFFNASKIWQKQRFLSIGSCGGIKAYRKLNRLFRNRVDILATVGTGRSSINNPYNIALLEIVAAGRQALTWDDVSEKTSSIFSQGQGGEYLQPGSLPAILHKMIYTDTSSYGTD